MKFIGTIGADDRNPPIELSVEWYFELAQPPLTTVDAWVSFRGPSFKTSLLGHRAASLSSASSTLPGKRGPLSAFRLLTEVVGTYLGSSSGTAGDSSVARALPRQLGPVNTP